VHWVGSRILGNWGFSLSRFGNHGKTSIAKLLIIDTETSSIQSVLKKAHLPLKPLPTFANPADYAFEKELRMLQIYRKSSLDSQPFPVRLGKT